MLYTGITTDYKRRFLEHTGINNKGAKFTKIFHPIEIKALWKTDNRSNASKLEIRIKKLSKDEKVNLISNNKLFKKYFNGILDISKFRRINKY